tara:strand:+ start:617 stop:1321 length:705 start_codon:yes stop_codon:yes gene_type:complete
MGKIRIVLVEDDKVYRFLIKEVLEQEGFEVHALGSSVEFFQSLLNNSFDILILDIGLPDFSGFSILEYLQKNKLHKDMGIAVLTSHTSSNDRIRGYELGADLYMLKPLYVKELCLAIHNLSKRITIQKSSNKETQVWSLDTSNWLISTPDGSSCKLSAKEMELVTQLSLAKGEVVNKYALASSLGYLDDEHGKRALESAVLRLRRKLAKTGYSNSPIKTVHGLGYAFSPYLNII